MHKIQSDSSLIPFMVSSSHEHYLATGIVCHIYIVQPMSKLIHTYMVQTHLLETSDLLACVQLTEKTHVKIFNAC